MKSYEAARGYFSILEFLSWVLIVVGLVVLLMGMAATNQLNSYRAGTAAVVIMAAVPGLALSFFGFLGLVAAQYTRAGVDSAEYTQQMLQIARDQLEVSRRSLNLQQGVPAAAFGPALKDASEETDQMTQATANGAMSSSPSFADRVGAQDDASSNSPPTIELEPEDAQPQLEDFSYRGRKIRAALDMYMYDGLRFENAEDVKAHIDAIGSSPQPIPPSLPAAEAGDDPEAEAEPVAPAPLELRDQSPLKAEEDEAIDYRDQKIVLVEGRFCVGNRGFRTLELAQNFIDQLAAKDAIDANKHDPTN